MSDKRQHVDALQTTPGRVNDLILAQKPHQPLESAHALRISFRWLNENEKNTNVLPHSDD